MPKPARAWKLIPPPRLVENDVERQCLDLLRLRGYWPVRLHAGTFKTADGARWIKGVDKGTPDYAALHARHRGFLLEVKRPGGELSPAQTFKINELRQGYRLAVAAVDTATALAAWLEAHERSP